MWHENKDQISEYKSKCYKMLKKGKKRVLPIIKLFQPNVGGKTLKSTVIYLFILSERSPRRTPKGYNTGIIINYPH